MWTFLQAVLIQKNPLAQIPGAVVLSSGLIEKEVLEIIAASLNFT